MQISTLLATLITAQIIECKILFLIRHGEKPVMDREATNLSPKGKVRADCIASIFNGDQFQSPKRIIAQPVGGGHRSTRPVDTVQPLANLLGLSVEQECGPKDYDCIENSVLRDDVGPVLISWEHKRLRKILKRFVSPSTNLPKIPKYIFDIVWKVDTEERSFTSYSQDCNSFFAAASLKASQDTGSETKFASWSRNDLTPHPFAHLTESRVIHVYQLPLSSLDADE